jgi:hypothetical protein
MVVYPDFNLKETEDFRAFTIPVTVTNTWVTDMKILNVSFNYLNADRNVTKTQNATIIGDKMKLEITKDSIGSNTSIDIT